LEAAASEIAPRVALTTAVWPGKREVLPGRGSVSVQEGVCDRGDLGCRDGDGTVPESTTPIAEAATREAEVLRSLRTSPDRSWKGLAAKSAGEMAALELLAIALATASARSRALASRRVLPGAML